MGRKPPPVPAVPVVTEGGADPFSHPDAQRCFRLIGRAAELERALDYPWDQRMDFLHTAQRRLVERAAKGPARVAGSARTGKTIVALDRAAARLRKQWTGVSC